MRYQINVPLIDIEGNPVVTPEDGTLSLGTILVRSVLATPRESSEKDKARDYELALKLQAAKAGDGVVDLAVSELPVLLSAVSRNWQTLVYGRVKDLFDNPIQKDAAGG